MLTVLCCAAPPCSHAPPALVIRSACSPALPSQRYVAFLEPQCPCNHRRTSTRWWRVQRRCCTASYTRATSSHPAASLQCSRRRVLLRAAFHSAHSARLPPRRGRGERRRESSLGLRRSGGCSGALALASCSFPLGIPSQPPLSLYIRRRFAPPPFSLQWKTCEFGRCPRVLCAGQQCLPVGQNDISRTSTVKIYCPKCEVSSRRAQPPLSAPFASLSAPVSWPQPTRVSVSSRLYRKHRLCHAGNTAAAGAAPLHARLWALTPGLLPVQAEAGFRSISRSRVEAGFRSAEAGLKPGLDQPKPG